MKSLEMMAYLRSLMNFFGMISNILVISLKQAKLEGNLSISQRQGVIKLLETKIHKKLKAYFFTQC